MVWWADTEPLKSSRHCVSAHLSAVDLRMLGRARGRKPRDAKSNGGELWFPTVARGYE